MHKLLLSLVAITILIGCSSDNTVAPTTGTIKGSVRNPTGTQFVPNVQITTAPATESLLTDAQGAFQIEEVTPGEYLIRAKYFDTAYASTSVSVKAGSTTTADLILTYGTPTSGVIQGVVKDASGAGVAGASVSTSPATKSVTTSSLGQYLLPDLAPGTYTVTATNGTLFGTTTAIVVASSVSDADITVFAQDPAKGWITGTVTKNDAPVANVIIQISTLSIADTTDATGVYTLPNVPTGTYTMTVTESGSSPRTYQVSVTAGSATVRNIKLSSSSDIPTEGLLLYLPFDNGSIQDESPIQRATSLLGGSFSEDRNGQPNGAFVNDGTLTNGIDVSHSTDLVLYSMTMGAWFYFSGTRASDGLLLGKNLHPGGDGYYFMIENGKLAFIYTTNDFKSALRVDLPIPMNTWFWAGMSISSTGSGIATVNGSENTMTRIGTPSSMQNTSSFRVGTTMSYLTTIKGLDGMIDNVVLYNRTMTVEELRQIMEATD